MNTMANTMAIYLYTVKTSLGIRKQQNIMSAQRKYFSGQKPLWIINLGFSSFLMPMVNNSMAVKKITEPKEMRKTAKSPHVLSREQPSAGPQSRADPP